MKPCESVDKFYITAFHPKTVFVLTNTCPDHTDKLSVNNRHKNICQLFVNFVKKKKEKKIKNKSDYKLLNAFIRSRWLSEATS